MPHSVTRMRSSGMLCRVALGALFLMCWPGASGSAQERRTARSDQSGTGYPEEAQEQSTASDSGSNETGALPDRPARNIPVEKTGALNVPGKTQPETPAAAEDQNRPPTTQEPNPYPNLPSLDDLYRKIPSQRSTLKRFGVDVFRNGTGNLDKLPMDLPAGPDYLLGTGDGVSINIRGSVPRTITKTVDREGRVSLPEAGTVVVAGQTVMQAQELIQKSLSTEFRDVKVDVSLTRLRTIRVYVVGDVERPGAYDISALSTALNALYMAGGPTDRGSLRGVRVYRGAQLIRQVDLYDLLLQGVRSGVERLEPGYTILVPPIGPEVTLAGMVRRPAIYELTSEKELADVLQLAGGMLVSASMNQISVERIEAHERRVMLKVNLPPATDAEGLNKALSGFHVQDGDYVMISPILPYSDQTIYLDGHVFRPGKYPYHPGMQIAELIRSYQDLLPEPSDHAEIVRLVPPDYHPVAIEFKLSEVLSGDDPIDLQNFDTVRILGRYEADPPTVFVFGQVLRPGKYPLAQGMTAAGLVRMAGGVTRSALTQEADIASYLVRGGSSIVTKHTTVEIGKALAGDREADVVLKPSDVMTVRQLTGWDDIGASVTINGQVIYPGTFGIEDGERLSALLERAGGFRDNAYPEGAVLERTQVRELAEKSKTQLIARIEAAGATETVSPTVNGPEQAAQLQARAQQRQQLLTVLRNQPATGRLVIKISDNIRTWQNTASDIEVRTGDVITIPKKPSFVLVNGQVYNASALSFVPGKNAGWYLAQAGGPTEMANKKEIYIIRASGLVVGRGSAASWWSGNLLSTTMHPGDTVVVPEKIIGDSHVWKNILDSAQLSASLAIAARVATSF
jgi:protein involved in polysaccharide export with SLBB domain